MTIAHSFNERRTPLNVFVQYRMAMWHLTIIKNLQEDAFF